MRPYGKGSYMVRERGENLIEDESSIDLVELLSTFWKQRLLIFIFILAGVVVADLYLRSVTYSYTAYLKVIPAQPSRMTGVKTQGLASLASIAGVGAVQDPGTLAFQLYTEGLHSRSVAEAIAQRPDVMRTLFISEWDARSRRFVQPPKGSLGRLSASVKSILGIPVTRWTPPNAARLQEYIETHVKAQKSEESPVVTITLEHKDPAFAVSFLKILHQVLDDNLRAKALGRSNQYIAYLSNQLRTVTLAEHRSAIADALSEQEKTKMMASSSLAFAADLFGPVTSSIRPTSPRPIMVLFFGVVAGAVLGTIVAAIRAGLGRRHGLSSPPVD